MIFPKTPKTIIELEREKRGLPELKVDETVFDKNNMIVGRKSTLIRKKTQFRDKISDALQKLQGKKERFMVQENLNKGRRFI